MLLISWCSWLGCLNCAMSYSQVLKFHFTPGLLLNPQKCENHNYGNDVHNKKTSSKTNGQIGKSTGWVRCYSCRVVVSTCHGITHLEKEQFVIKNLKVSDFWDDLKILILGQYIPLQILPNTLLPDNSPIPPPHPTSEQMGKGREKKVK